MTMQLFEIPRFYGINQSTCQNAIHAGESPDAENMETRGGYLRVAKGYARHVATKHPSPATLRRLYVRHTGTARTFVTVGKNDVFAICDGEDVWRTLHTDAALTTAAEDVDFLSVKIASTEQLLLANRGAQLQKWDGMSGATERFGSTVQLSDIAVNFVELYYNRLFAAGDPAHPCRLYWSAAPGDDRTIEDWRQNDASPNVGGGFVEVGTDSDPITGLFALSNQLVIFKRDSVYRLLGDRPANYRIYPVNAATRQAQHTACVRYGDVLYFLTERGLYYYDGQTVHRQPDADKVTSLLETADLSHCIGACCGDRLYFALRRGTGDGNDTILVYDLMERTYMVRTGFSVIDLVADGGVLFLLDGNGAICRFEEGEDYDGQKIHAYWNTPLTDLGNKLTNKHLLELVLRGEGGILAISATAGGNTTYYERLMPQEAGEVVEMPVTGSGRAFYLTLKNENGSRFCIDGGLAVLLELQRRVL